MSDRRHKDGYGEVHLDHVRHPEAAYDRTDLGARGIIWFLVGLAIFLVFVHVIIWGFERVYARFEPKGMVRTSAIITNEQQTGPKGDPVTRFPQPTLQPDPVADMNKYREAVEQQLNSAGWIDQKAGVAHIPVDKAIDILAQRGLPVRPQPPQEQHAKFGTGDGSVPGAGGGTEPRGNK